jgi:tetratricopeptide (TPR) repeat protein
MVANRLSKAGRIRFAVAFSLFAALGSFGQGGRTAASWKAEGDVKSIEGDWYAAIECYLEAVAVNPNYYEALYALAECYYELGEYDQALTYVERAVKQRAGEPEPKDLEGFIRLALGQADAARAIFKAVIAAWPNDADARFGLALLDVADGRVSDARARYEEALRASPRDSRALLSLALVAWRQGDLAKAKSYAERALDSGSGDARVHYFAAYVAALTGDFALAIERCEAAIAMRPKYRDAIALLSSLYFQTGDWEGAARVSSGAVAADRRDSGAWFTYGMARAAQGRVDEAIAAFKGALAAKVDDEVARIALENLVIDEKALEDPSREPLADWHFTRARAYERERSLELSLFEFRRGLRVYPYSKTGRFDYARALRASGYPGRHLQELLFLKDLGKADVEVNDLIEAWSRTVASGVAGRWGIDQFALEKRPYAIAVYSMPSAENAEHSGGDRVIARYLRDLFLSSAQIALVDSPPVAASFSQAFRAARESGADYFLIVASRESRSEIQIEATMYVARTGSLAGGFSAYRAGNDRVRDAARKVVDSIAAKLAPRGEIVARSRGRIVASVGRREGIAVGMKFSVIRKGALQCAHEGLGFSYSASDALGTFTVTAVDEEVCEGDLSVSGSVDAINVGDELIPAGMSPSKAPMIADGSYPTLFALLGKLR